MLFIYEDIDVPIICLLIIKYLWNYHSSTYRSINHLLIYQPFLYVSSVYHLSTYQPITYLMSIIYWLIIYLPTISTIKDRDTIYFFFYRLSLSSKLKNLPQRRSRLVIFHYGSYKTNWFYKLLLLLCYSITLAKHSSIENSKMWLWGGYWVPICSLLC